MGKDLLDRLSQEKRQNQNSLKINLDAIIWQGFLDIEKNYLKLGSFMHDYYKYALENLPENYSAKDINSFSKSLNHYKRYQNFNINMGAYISALCNSCKEENITIDFKEYNGLMSFLGIYNTKNITINGNVGYCVGEYSKKGTIIVNGNAGDFLGASMNDGKIRVFGDCGKCVGHHMKSGDIEVYGNSGDSPGASMENGRIAIYGNAGDYVDCFSEGGVVEILGTCKSIHGTGHNTTIIGNNIAQRIMNGLILKSKRKADKIIDSIFERILY